MKNDFKNWIVRNYPFAIFVMVMAAFVSIPAVVVGIFHAATDDGNSILIRAARLTQALFSLGLIGSVIAGTFFTLRHIYKRRRIDSYPVLYLKLGVGAATIPFLSAVITLVHYEISPEQYSIPTKVISSFSPHTAEQTQLFRDNIERNNDRINALQSIEVALQEEIKERKYLEVEQSDVCIKKNAYPFDGDYIIATSNPDYYLCVFYFPNGERYGVEIVSLQIRSIDKKEIVVDFTSLFVQYEERCPLYKVFLSGTRLLKKVSALELSLCFKAGVEGLKTHNAKLESRIVRSSSYPPYGFGHMLLHQLSRSLGTDYKILQPVGVVAGVLAVVWSMLLAAYFFMFVAIVLLRRE